MPDHTLLLVDDEPNVLGALKRVFRREPYLLLTACGGEEALALLEKEPVSLILSDQRMPKMGGLELLKRAKKQWPDTIRIMLTGYTDIQMAMPTIDEVGVYRFLLKPWNDDDVRMTVERALHQWDLTSENRNLHTLIRKQGGELKLWKERFEEKIRERTEHLEQKVKELERPPGCTVG
ncbi:MAG: response regulator [Candidatus Latescibacteria bacterium]|nr:response regulator [Candidatus Latescibacterota bacterium]